MKERFIDFKNMKNIRLNDNGYLVEEDVVNSTITYIHTKYTDGSDIAWKECSIHSIKMMYDKINDVYYCPGCER